MKFKTILILFILLIFTIILFQNVDILASVSIHLLFWKFETVSPFILFPLILFVGIIIGFLFAGTRRKNKQKKKEHGKI